MKWKRSLTSKERTNDCSNCKASDRTRAWRSIEEYDKACAGQSAYHMTKEEYETLNEFIASSTMFMVDAWGMSDGEDREGADLMCKSTGRAKSALSDIARRARKGL